MGTIYPIGADAQGAARQLLRAESAQKKTLGMQTLFEGMAVGIMDFMRSESRNPLLHRDAARASSRTSRATPRSAS